MSELDAAWTWYQAQAARLKALDDLQRDGRNLENPLLQSLLADLIGATQKSRTEKIRREREELRRIALVRLFFAFEADFRAAFADRLRVARAAQNGNSSTSGDEVLKSLGVLTKLLDLHQALDPRDLPPNISGRVANLRLARNQLAHEGFQGLSVDSPETVYQDLKSALAPMVRAAAP